MASTAGACLPSAPAWAQAAEDPVVVADPVPDTTITVVATGLPDRIGATAQPLAIFGQAEINAVQGADIARVLQRSPSVTINRNGGLGSFTGIRLRGADAEQLLVLVDGVRVADVASPADGFDFGTLPSSEVGRIELLRSANSVIWGSQAIAGVLALSTHGGGTGSRTGPVPDSLDLSAEYGAHRTASLAADGATSLGALTLGAQGGVLDTAGISSAAAGTEADGLRQWHAGGHADLALGSGLSAFIRARIGRARLDLDGTPAPDYLLVDTAEYQHTRQHSGVAGLRLERPRLSLVASWSAAHTARDSFDPAFGTAPTYSTHGHSDRAELRGRWTPGQWRINFGAEQENARFSSSFDAQQRARTRGAYVQLGIDRQVTANAGLRVEDHPGFGTVVVSGADAAVPLGGGWRATASFGQGFKAPSLFQLHSDYGNAALRPERSTGFDLGLARGNRNSGQHFALALFRRDSTSLIDFISCTGNAAGLCAGRPDGTYGNVGKARAQGVEAEAHVRLAQHLALGAAYSFTRAENRATGQRLARRPLHAATLTADWQEQAFTVGADLRLVSASFDDAAETVRLPGYAVLDARLSAPLSARLELFGRIENLLGEQYQTAAGYGTPGRSAYAGVRATW